MARKITSGITGRSQLGALTTINNHLQSVVTNANIVFEPNGTGIVQSRAHIQINDGNTLRLADNDSSTYVALKSPATLGSSYTLTFPSNDGNTDQMLQTNGSGAMTWATPFITLSDQTSSSTTHYPMMSTSTSGKITANNVSSSKLTFTPNNGRLTATIIATGNAAITGGSITGTSISGSTGSFSTLTETSSIILKDNVNPIVNALQKVLMLDGVNYNRKETGKFEAGLIAEEVEKIVPELVDNNGEFKSVQYTRITAYLIESIKSLKQELDDLKKINIVNTSKET
jgi:hypothetical protein|tara:strand:- start:355 stop:1212 length:858 start_codon:yes stop_codon:yes gene_type:complete